MLPLFKDMASYCTKKVLLVMEIKSFLGMIDYSACTTDHFSPMFRPLVSKMFFLFLLSISFDESYPKAGVTIFVQ